MQLHNAVWIKKLQAIVLALLPGIGCVISNDAGSLCAAQRGQCRHHIPPWVDASQGNSCPLRASLAVSVTPCPVGCHRLGVGTTASHLFFFLLSSRVPR